MRLTKKKALDISIELWEDMEKTGRGHKDAWVGWKKYGKMLNDCPLCAYVGRNKEWEMRGECKSAPLNGGLWVVKKTLSLNTPTG